MDSRKPINILVVAMYLLLIMEDAWIKSWLRLSHWFRSWFCHWLSTGLSCWFCRWFYWWFCWWFCWWFSCWFGTRLCTGFCWWLRCWFSTRFTTGFQGHWQLATGFNTGLCCWFSVSVSVSLIFDKISCSRIRNTIIIMILMMRNTDWFHVKGRDLWGDQFESVFFFFTKNTLIDSRSFGPKIFIWIGPPLKFLFLLHGISPPSLMAEHDCADLVLNFLMTWWYDDDHILIRWSWFDKTFVTKVTFSSGQTSWCISCAWFETEDGIPVSYLLVRARIPVQQYHNYIPDVHFFFLMQSDIWVISEWSVSDIWVCTRCAQSVLRVALRCIDQW